MSSEHPEEPEIDLPDEVIAETVPDDDIVLAYITHGSLARYVETVASLNPDFFEELEASIDGLIEAGEPISDAAYAWRTEGVDEASLVPPAHDQEEPEPGPLPEETEDEAPYEEHVAPVVDLAPARQGRATAIYIVLAVAAGLLLFVGGGFLQHQQQDRDRLQAAKELETLEKEAQVRDLAHRLEEQQKELAAAQADLASARDDADRAAAQAKLAAAQQQVASSQANISAVKNGAAGGASSHTKPACKCQPGDPLCSCL